MEVITNTRLWKETLAPVEGETGNTLKARDKLRACFSTFRERAGLIAAEIHRDLPEFTVHDITHLDALWEIADIIAGEEFSLTPAEAFVLGGTFLLHDLGMSLAAYPNGIEDLKNHETWNDTIIFQFMEKNDRPPTEDELASPTPEAVTSATGYLLRSLHAEKAEELGVSTWSFDEKETPLHLIEDSDIRHAFGRIVGLIAHSHWWPIQKLEEMFARTIGASHWCPNEWTVDPLKIACLLRLADAGHIDARRAPCFLRAIRNIPAISAEHWAFQQRLGKPHLTMDSLSYTTGYAFPFDESTAWWTCFDTLRMIDGELRAVDSLLADQGMQRFAAKRIAGVEAPERLTLYIPTSGWTPVDASVQVGDVPRLMKSLGGEELYGRDLGVPLRELIQNAADALRARWAIEKRPEGWGSVTVRLGHDNGGHWIEVEDSGIGMSSIVLTKYLLDFSTSFWGSSAMIDELPGLLGSGFRPTGKYGIGFFSVFMLGDSVKIRTRRADAAQKDTQILEFNTGLGSRPVLRDATGAEVLRDGGTCVKVWLRTPPDATGGLLHNNSKQSQTSLFQKCRELCPALPVTLECYQDGVSTTAISASDWQKCTGSEFLPRMYDGMMYYRDVDENAQKEMIEKAGKNLRVLEGPDGTIYGRACIGVGMHDDEKTHLQGAVTVGGFRACTLSGIVGVLLGKSERAARDFATPIVSGDVLAKWATEQASLVQYLYDNPDSLMKCATTVWRCGGDTENLPIAKFSGSHVSYRELADADFGNEVLLVSPYRVSDFEDLEGFTINSNVIISESGSWMSILQSSSFSDWPDSLLTDRKNEPWVAKSLGGRAIQAVAESWELPLDVVFKWLIKQEDAREKRIKRVIGNVKDQEIKSDVIVLTKSEISNDA